MHDALISTEKISAYIELINGSIIRDDFYLKKPKQFNKITNLLICKRWRCRSTFINTRIDPLLNFVDLIQINLKLNQINRKCKVTIQI